MKPSTQVILEMLTKPYRRSLTIAGSDSGGGAGIQADLKTFAAVGVHGMSAVTSVTAQNTYEVASVQDVSLDNIERQIGAVVRDIGVDSAKTGMLHTEEIIGTVASELSQYDFEYVLDPVMVAKSGAKLLEDDAVSALKSELLPLAQVVTPNLPEAQVLADAAKGEEDPHDLAERIAELGPGAVVVKGGHSSDPAEAVDVLYADDEFITFTSRRIPTEDTHGTGCVFSAAIAGYLALDSDLEQAVSQAKQLVFNSVRYSLRLGGGHGPVNPLAVQYLEREKTQIVEQLTTALEILDGSTDVTSFVPEVRMNVAYCIPKPYDRWDVAAYPGRVTAVDDTLKAAARPEFGASRHLSSYLVNLNPSFPPIRSAINIKFSERTLEEAKGKGWELASFDRSEEPKEIREVEGRSIRWGVRRITDEREAPPDLIWHSGAQGKEPMIVVLGEDPFDTVNKVKELA